MLINATEVGHVGLMGMRVGRASRRLGGRGSGAGAEAPRGVGGHRGSRVRVCVCAGDVEHGDLGSILGGGLMGLLLCQRRGVVLVI